MSNDKITLRVAKRTELGKAAKRLRKTGVVPANIYERGKESRAISAGFSELTKVFQQAGKHHPVELDVEGSKQLVMIKDVDADPVKGFIRHVAFHAIKQNEKVEAEVPVRVDGVTPAEKASLLILHTMDTLDIEALPSNLPDELLFSADLLKEVGDKATVADVVVPSGVTILNDPEQTLAVVEEPKDQIAAAAAEAEENTDASEVPSDKGGDSSEQASEA